MHSKKQIGRWLLILLSGSILSCSSSLYVPHESALIPKETLSALQKGRAIYITKCGSCHTLYLPEKYSTSEWRIQTGKMAVKAKLTDHEEELIIRYLTKNNSSNPH
ncbi:MAG: hypothetical protein M0Q53_05220 [Prolixibacteraceae bacterium]|jgi:hypothetical protein|nr:hypothetical protein [Prolixibacteraceae bacterium]